MLDAVEMFKDELAMKLSQSIEGNQFLRESSSRFTTDCLYNKSYAHTSRCQLVQGHLLADTKLNWAPAFIYIKKKHATQPLHQLVRIILISASSFFNIWIKHSIQHARSFQIYKGSLEIKITSNSTGNAFST